MQRRLVVSCNVAGRDVGSLVADIRAAVGRSAALPSGCRIVYGGQFESAAAAARTLSLLSLLCRVGVFGLLYAAFRSARDALLVMLNLPLALILFGLSSSTALNVVVVPALYRRFGALSQAAPAFDTSAAEAAP